MNAVENAIEKFEQGNMAEFQTLAFIQKQKKDLEEQEKKIRNILMEGMKKYNVVSVDNDIVRLNYIPESESVTIDTKKFRVGDPELYNSLLEKYNKRTKRRESLRITVK